MSKENLFIEDKRDLSVKETNLIDWLLVETGHFDLKEQIGQTKVVSKCSCGCPTIDLEVTGSETNSLRLVLSAQGVSPEGIPVGVILHVRNGLLVELEVYSEGGTEIFSLPEISNLRVI